jgi:IclR family transcriptional regulator, KDG regulon repressor
MSTERGSARDTEMLGSVRNAARVLRAFAGGEPELGVTDLSRGLGIGKSTVHRIVSTLTAEGLLERGRQRGTYRLGPVAEELAVRASDPVDLHEAALPVLVTLREATGETVVVAVRDGDEIVYVDVLNAGASALAARVGTRLPAARTAAGRVLLGTMAPDEVARGFVVNDGEGRAGVVAVAAPVRGNEGEVLAALSVVADAARMHGAVLRQNAARLLDCAATVSRRVAS